MKRLLSWLLVLTMLVACLPMSVIPALATETDVDTSEDSDMELEMDELLPGYSEANPVDLTNDLVYEGDFSATVTVPAGKTMYFISYRIAGMNMTINDGEAVVCTGDNWTPYAWTITNDGEAAADYVIKVAFPEGHQMNPKVIEEMNWYSDEVVQELGDFDGFYYTYTAVEDGDITLYFDAVYDDEGNVVDCGVRDIQVNDLTDASVAQYTLLNDGVDFYGMQLVVPVKAGHQYQIITSWVEDAEGNAYPAGTYSWTGNFTYPAGTEQNPIAIEWTWDEDYANATASVTVEADGTYYIGQAGMILTVGGVETEMDEAGNFVLNAGTYELALATPVGAQNNPEVIENMVGYSDTNSLAEGESYYYIWTATEDGTVTLDVTDGANLTVDKLTYTEDSEWPISTQYILAEYAYSDDWTEFLGWTVAENLVIDVVAGEQLKIQVVGYSNADAWTVPATDYTLTGNFEAAIELFKWSGMSVELKDSLAAKFVFPKAAIVGEGNYAVISKEVYNKTTGEITIENITVPQSEWVAYNASLNAIIFNGVAAMQMMDEFTVIIYNANGQQISESYVRTIADYLYGRLTANIAQSMKNLAVDFLNYGSACQGLFSYRPTELANAGLTDTQKGWATSDEAVSDITSEQVKGSCFAGFTVAAEYEIIPSFVYQNSKITNVTYANVSYTDFQGNSVNYDIQASDFAAYNASMTKVVINGTSVPDGASPITVTLYAADGTVVDQSIDCVSYYAVRQYSKHEAYGALLKLIYSAGIAF